jgi:hypothetical protein
MGMRGVPNELGVTTVNPSPQLRLLAGWLSALVGNLAFRLGDSPAAAIHFSTAARLGTLRE